MSAECLKKIALRTLIGIYLALGVYTQVGLMEILPLEQHLLADFLIYQRAAKDAALGVDPYEEKRIGAAFVYPPQSLLFFETAGVIQGRKSQAVVYTTINIAMLWFMTYAVIRHGKLTHADAWFFYPLALGFAPFLELLHIGQVNQFVAFGLFLMFTFATQMPWLAGLGLGWAAMLKVTPAVFIAYLLITKQWKAIAATAITILIFTLITWIRYGADPFFNYVEALRSMLRQFPDGLESHSLFAVINRFIDIHEYAPILQMGLNIYLVLILASGALSMYINRTDLFFVVLGVGVTMTPNLLWYHHYVFLLLPLFVLMRISRLDARIVTWCLVGFIIIQMDRFYLTAGLLIHIFAHLTILGLIVYQIDVAWKQYGYKTALPA